MEADNELIASEPLGKHHLGKDDNATHLSSSRNAYFVTDGRPQFQKLCSPIVGMTSGRHPVLAIAEATSNLLMNLL